MRNLGILLLFLALSLIMPSLEKPSLGATNESIKEANKLKMTILEA